MGTTTKKDDFISKVYAYYKTSGRNDLPWRINTDPYRILVSELMLQQTQVDRVIQKYNDFISAYPTITDLANGNMKDVLMLWQGLGYNRRAKFLFETANILCNTYEGSLPKEKSSLVELPGVGNYTASAVRVFSFNIPDILIETNIRTVYISYFYSNETSVSDDRLEVLLEDTLDHDNPREWYWALMDYGSYIKKTQKNYSRQSAVYKKQTTFKGSKREVRGAVIKILLTDKQSLAGLYKLPFEKQNIKVVLEELLREGMISKKKNIYFLS